MLYEYFRVLGSHEAVFDFCDLMGVTLRGDDVSKKKCPFLHEASAE